MGATICTISVDFYDFKYFTKYLFKIVHNKKTKKKYQPTDILLFTDRYEYERKILWLH